MCRLDSIDKKFEAGLTVLKIGSTASTKKFGDFNAKFKELNEKFSSKIYKLEKMQYTKNGTRNQGDSSSY